MKKLLTTAAISLLFVLSVVPAMALDYNIGAADGPTYANPTSVDPVIVVGGGVTESSNIDRSKNSALIPPPFGSPESYQTGSGTPLIPQSSTTTNNAATSTPSSGTVNPGTVVPSTSTPSTSTSTLVSGSTGSTTVGSSEVYYPPAQADSTPGSVSTSSDNRFTLPDGLFYSDGSLGQLKISKIGLSVKVYETESLESLAKGAGHFKSTSCWDGNVGLAGHNRGVTNHFGLIHTLKTGDTITYTTQLGTRNYSVFFVGKIEDTDFSRLERTSENIITLVTCVENVPSMRWCVQAREIS